MSQWLQGPIHTDNEISGKTFRYARWILIRQSSLDRFQRKYQAGINGFSCCDWHIWYPTGDEINNPVGSEPILGSFQIQAPHFFVAYRNVKDTSITSYIHSSFIKSLMESVIESLEALVMYSNCWSSHIRHLISTSCPSQAWLLEAIELL